MVSDKLRRKGLWSGIIRSMSILDVKKYAERKARGKTQLRLDGTNAILSVQKYDEPNDVFVWKDIETTNVKHLNDLIDSVQREKKRISGKLSTETR